VAGKFEPARGSPSSAPLRLDGRRESIAIAIASLGGAAREKRSARARGAKK